MSQILQQEVKQELKASQIIRSFRFPQVSFRFKTRDGFCVMGGLLNHFGYDMFDVEFPQLGEWLYNPAVIKVKELLGYKGYDLLGDSHADIWTELVRMNNDGKTFSEIADWLEERGL